MILDRKECCRCFFSRRTASFGRRGVALGRVAGAIALCLVVLTARAEEEKAASRYENRWIFALQYLNTDLELVQTKALIRRAKTAGYNGLAFISGKDYTAADAKVVYGKDARAYRAAYTGLEDVELMEPARLARFKELKRFCDAEKFDFVPLVWSAGYCSMQYADPNFAACWPVRDVPYLVKDGRARFVAEPVQADVSSFNRLYDCMKRNGNSESVKFAVKPCRRYRLSTCVKIEGVLRKSVYGGVGPTYGVFAKSCDSGQFSSSHHDDFEPVQDWTDTGFTFVTGEEDDEVTLCCRANAYDVGRIHIRDARLEELGVEYPVRRAGTRFEVRDAANGRVYREGVDYAVVPAVDLLRHDRRERPLELEILASGAIVEGARLLVSAWEPKSVSDSQFTACFTNPALKEYYRRSARGLVRELGVTKWFMSADEIRVGCRCENCLKDPDVAGVRLGKDYRAQYDAIRAACPDADIYMWPDMANVNHNAMDKYYLMRTTTKGALDFVPTDVTMVSWWGAKAPINLPYYTARGYRTMGAGYYDKRSAEATRKSAADWRPQLDETPNARGYMYTTWLYGVAANFAFLEDFADAWATARPYAPTVPGALPRKLMSFNVCSGHGDAPRYGIPKDDPCAHFEECAAVIRRECPDWCSVQEVDVLAERTAKVDQVHELARRTGMFPVFGQAIKHRGGQAAGAYGVMTLSRERPLRYWVVPLADASEDRVLLVTEFDRFIAVATHFSLHPDCALVAAKKVNELFARSEKPVFLAGDLNSTPDSAVIAELKKGFVALSDAAKPTWPTDVRRHAQARTIDWIFVNRAHAAQFADARAEVLPDTGPSDHFPVVVTFGR